MGYSMPMNMKFNFDIEAIQIEFDLYEIIYCFQKLDEFIIIITGKGYFGKICLVYYMRRNNLIFIDINLPFLRRKT